MATHDDSDPAVLRAVEGVGRSSVRGLASFGYGATLVWDSLGWLLLGRRRGQTVRPQPVFAEMMEIGVRAIPIVSMLAVTIGIMLAIQGIHTLKTFGAESQVVYGIAFSVTREFGPLITGILIAGRSGSALAARIGTMQVNQEIDALRVMGINPARYLIAPALLAMLIMVPTLTFFSDLAAMLGGAVYSGIEMGLSFDAYTHQSLDILTSDDIYQGLKKSFVFAAIIVMVGVVNGFSVQGGAEGVGKATTRSVVMAISYIVIADMLFTYFLNR